MFLRAGLTRRTPLGLILALLFSAVLLGSLLQSFVVNTPKAFATTCDRYSATQLINCNGTGSDYWNNTSSGTTTGTIDGGPGGGPPPLVRWGLKTCDIWTVNPNAQVGQESSYYPADEKGWTCATTFGTCPPNAQGLPAYGMIVEYTRTSTTTTTWTVHPDTATCTYPWTLVTSTVTKLGDGKGRCLRSVTENLYYAGTSASTATNQQGTKVAGPKVGQTDFYKQGVKGLPGDCTNGDVYKLNWSPALPKYSTATNALCQGKADGSSCRGYYYIEQVNEYQDCIKKTYPAWTNKPPTYECPKKPYKVQVAPEYYTNSCKVGVERGLNLNADFQPDACNTKWTCDINDTTINGQSAKDAVTAIRNGSPLVAKVPNVKFSGSGVDKSSITNVRGRTSVVANSSPWNTDTGVNSRGQYFYRASQATDAGDNQVPFDSPFNIDYDPSKVKTVSQYLFFYWASDPNMKWQMKTTYQFDGYFYNPNSTNLDGSTKIIREWKANATCQDHGDTISYSPKVTVVRSITSG